jgi:acetylornithine deacetylase
MKSFLACALAAAPMFLAAPLKRPVHLAFTYDEEVGCLGAPVLIRDLQASGLRPAGCIVGEPTLMQVMTRHKGLRVYRCRVQGLEAHSSLAPSGVNAIEYASRLIERVRAIALDLRDQGPRDEGYSVPWMTLSTTMIHGGTASNIIPRECEFRFDMRTLPGIDAEEIVTRLRRYAADELLPEMIGASTEADIRIELAEHAPELATADDSAIAALGARLADNPRLGRVPFATDGGHFQRSGIPTVVIGPGSVEQAHKPNETIAIEQIVQCQRFLDRLKDALCA